MDDILKIVHEASLPCPDYIIGGVGTQMFDCRTNQSVPEFNDRFQDGWDLATVEQILAGFAGITRQPPEFLHPYKSSWYLRDASFEALNAIQKQLMNAGLNVSLIYSSARDLDVLPANTSKGHALQWLCHQIGVPLEQILVAGDTGNDSSMFLLPGVKGIVIKNALPELHEATARLPIFKAMSPFADGVLQGLAHLNVISPAAAKLNSD